MASSIKLSPYRAEEVSDLKTFRVGGSAALVFGRAVKLDAGTEDGVIVAADDGLHIGWIQPDASWEATSGTATFAVGKLAPVLMRGRVLRGTAGTAISIGDVLLHDSSGLLTGDDAAGSAQGMKVVGIALDSASAASNQVDFVQL